MEKIVFELNRLERNCSDDSIIDEIRRVAKLIPSQHITRKEFDEQSKISSSTVVKRFKGWNEALKKAGLENRYSGTIISTRMRTQIWKGKSDKALIKELRKVAKHLNSKTLTKEDFRKISTIHPDTIKRRFGSWAIALQAAGLKLSHRGRRYSENDYFENMLEVWMHHGRQPKYREMDEEPSKISSGAYEQKWGSWRKALIAFIDKMNLEDEASIQESTLSSSKKNQKIQKEQKDSSKSPNIRTIPLRLRYRVLKRDNFKCILCGDHPATNPKCKLEIDHIMPFSQGGKTIEENLRTLCMKCNQGKADRL